MQELCRLCLGSEAAEPIFAGAPSLAERIHYAAGLQPCPADGLPRQICRPCLRSLHLAFSFKSQCERSDLILRQQLVAPDLEDELSSYLVHTVFSSEEPTDNVEDYVNAYEELPPYDEEESPKTKKSYTCHLCNKVLTRNYDLQRHIFLIHSKLDEPTDMKIFNDRQQSPSGWQPRYECDVCKKKYFERRLFMMHLETTAHLNATLKHPDPIKEYKCGMCNKSFSHRALLVEHEQKYKDEHYNCTMCDKPFCDRTRHLRECKTIVKLKKNCSADKLNLKPIVQLTKIQNLNNSEGQYFCSLCITSFRDRSDLNFHLENHQDTNMCYWCYETFNGADELKGHTNEKHMSSVDIKCLMCEESVAERYFLQHLKYHFSKNEPTPKKEHRCDVCKRSFTRRYLHTLHCKSQRHLKNVMLVGKKIVCDLCDAEFNHKSRYKSHRKLCAQ